MWPELKLRLVSWLLAKFESETASTMCLPCWSRALASSGCAPSALKMELPARTRRLMPCPCVAHK